MALTQAQRQLRKGLGSSMMGTLMGVNPWKTRDELKAEVLGLTPEFTGNFDTRLGDALEPVIANEWAVKHATAIAKGTTVKHPEFEWAFATPDFLIIDPTVHAYPPRIIRILEIKNVRWRKKIGDPKCLRASYVYQTRWQMACLGVEFGSVFIHYMAAPEADRFEEIPIVRDLSIEADLFQKASDFWTEIKQAREEMTNGNEFAATGS
jgi:predicted phage-related endonuclease